MKGTPLTVAEARAILAADEALDRTFKEREESGQTLGIAESEAWIALVASANDRIASYEGGRRLIAEVKASAHAQYPGGNEPDFQTLFVEAMAVAASDEPRSVEPAAEQGGYTARRLTADDLSAIDEMLRVSLEDPHWSAGHSRFREIREKMIVRLAEVLDQAVRS